jgi:hypothetical protein
MTIDNGGSIFPLNALNVSNAGAFVPSPGISLRDYIAVRAMSVLITDDYNPARIAIAAYEHADAMLIAREVKNAEV